MSAGRAAEKGAPENVRGIRPSGMGFWHLAAARVARRVLPLVGALVFTLVGANVLFGCGADERAAATPGSAEALAPVRCIQDEVREFQCESLLALGPALSAPAPFEGCPITMDIGYSQYPTDAKLARFDPSYTSYIRERSSPGNNCCYSWCSRVKVVDPALAPAAGGCGSPLSFRESYCMTQLETGSQGQLAQPPYDRCPVAIEPPAAAAFSVPKAALLDVGSTTQRRAKGRPECCYSWCSQAPPGTGLERERK